MFVCMFWLTSGCCCGRGSCVAFGLCLLECLLSVQFNCVFSGVGCGLFDVSLVILILPCLLCFELF